MKSRYFDDGAFVLMLACYIAPALVIYFINFYL